MCMAKTLSLNLVETVNIIREVSRELNEQLSTGIEKYQLERRCNNDY